MILVRGFDGMHVAPTGWPGERASDLVPPHRHAILSFVLGLEGKPLPLSIGTDGVIRVTGTRVPLETIVAAFDAGATVEEIVQQYSSLDLPDIYAVISWVLENRPAVDRYVDTRREAARVLREAVERNDAAAGMRARLLARRPRPSA